MKKITSKITVFNCITINLNFYLCKKKSRRRIDSTEIISRFYNPLYYFMAHYSLESKNICNLYGSSAVQSMTKENIGNPGHKLRDKKTNSRLRLVRQTSSDDISRGPCYYCSTLVLFAQQSIIGGITTEALVLWGATNVQPT